MDLPDCPPGAEGYQDSVVEVAKKPSLEENCTKAEQEFKDHLNSLKIKVENDETRPMVERRGRDISGKWIYLCYPCAAMCSGESILQTHISGKKHKTKLAMRTVWPMSIFEEHPYIVNEKGGTKTGGATEKILQKMAEEVDLHNKNPTDLDLKYNKYRKLHCHIQDSLDSIKAPLLGVEYLIEHPPEQEHYEPSYMCTLCSKQGHPRTIINHMTCFWHRCNYLMRHFPKASALLSPYRGQNKYREGVSVIMNRLAQRVEDKYGRMRPVNIDKEEYEKDRERIHQWIFKGYHFSENGGQTFEEVVDVDLINSLHKSNLDCQTKTAGKAKDPSPPVVAAPSKPQFNSFTRPAGRQERRAGSAGSLSDVSDEPPRRAHERDDRDRPPHRFRGRYERPTARYEPYTDKRRDASPPPSAFRSRFAIRNAPTEKGKGQEGKRPPNYEYKLKLAEEQRKAAEESAKKTLAYHEKNPEKHPLYPEEWKKFWNRRYKEIQTEGKDPSKHDFKPEWIVYWTTRMKELHDEELRGNVIELYRKLCLTPPNEDCPPDPIRKPEAIRKPDLRRRSPDPRRRSPEVRRRSPDPRWRSPEHKKPPDVRRRSPDRRRSPELRRLSPNTRRLSPNTRRLSPNTRRLSPNARRLSPNTRRLSPDMRRSSPDTRRRSPDTRRRSPELRRDRRSPDLRRSPVRLRSSEKRLPNTRSRSPKVRARSQARTHIQLESVRRSRSPLSRRDEASRNRSPQHEPPSMQTVMISDDELKPDDGLSPWNSDNDLDSLGSLPDAKSPVHARSRSRTGSMVSSHASRPRYEYTQRAEPQDLGPAENVVATLRLLVALEDYLGSLGPKIVDLLTEALRMEKECANSSEELLVRESAVGLLETAKEKLKGAVQAGLVPAGAAPAVRTAVVRAAATLHEADTRVKRKQQKGQMGSRASAAPMPVVGVGDVDRAQIAQQMAAALIAQGKTDVTSEELAQLVDAVVGMAEAKKREAEVKKKVEARAVAEKASRPAPAPPPPAAVKPAATSALQLLQSAYDENDKKVDKEVPDAMDGLSDSDLETLLKNFNELSAEEQHSLIAYLKKLEAKEPARVERLRQYVSTAAATAPPAEEPKRDTAEPPKAVVTVDSDDDDYTVEEVFKSAKQKVKEDRIRQEMEIVKKSLEELNSAPAKPQPPTSVSTATIVDLTNSISSASGLLALVQASLQSTSADKSATRQTADVVASTTQPRSFGDRPQSSIEDTQVLDEDHNEADSSVPMQIENDYDTQDGFANVVDYEQNRNLQEQGSSDMSGSNQQMPMNNMSHSSWDEPMNNMSVSFRDGSMNNMSRDRPTNNMSDSFRNDRPMMNMPDSFRDRPMGDSFRDRSMNMPDSFRDRPMGDSFRDRSMGDSFHERPLNDMPDTYRDRPLNTSDSFRDRPVNPMSDFIRDRTLNAMSDSFRDRPMNNMSDSFCDRPMSMSDSFQDRPLNNMPDSFQNRPMSDSFRDRPMNTMSGSILNRPMNMSDSVLNRPMNTLSDSILNRPLGSLSDPFRDRPMNTMPDSYRSRPMNNMSNSNMLGNKPPLAALGARAPEHDLGVGPGPRGGFMNNRMQDTFDSRPQPFGNNNQGSNFRGRGGRGQFGGPTRGRGRGYY